MRIHPHSHTPPTRQPPSFAPPLRATLRPELGGGEVAVKVQRPAVLEQVALDLMLMRRAAVAMKEAAQVGARGGEGGQEEEGEAGVVNTSSNWAGGGRGAGREWLTVQNVVERGQQQQRDGSGWERA
mgnify:CR=1 FL=1